MADTQLAPHPAAFKDTNVNRALYTNAVTSPKRRTDIADKTVTRERMEELVHLAKAHLKDDELYRWNADINGVTVQLVANSLHQYDFWVDNWFPANYDRQPDAVIYSVMGVPEQPSAAYYCKALQTIAFFNTNYYGQCKSWALGLADAVLRAKGTHSIHGSCVDVNGRGTVMIAPTGTGKSTHSYGLLEYPGTSAHSDDWLYIDYTERGGQAHEAIAAISERSFYLRTDTAREIPYMQELFWRCKTENVVTDPGQCIAPGCQPKESRPSPSCMFTQGHDRCFWGFPNSRAILDPTWVAGAARFVRKSRVAHVVLLTRDEQSPVEQQLSAEQGVEVLREGRYMVLPGAGAREEWGKMKNESWYNPYLLDVDHAFQEAAFRRLFTVADVYLINTGKGTVNENRERIKRIAFS
ncbi:MAG: hypothetical protein HY597_00435 [Candidatus Omnitrophica bacterium]|nr:hypothetical protein [Candidatus Omnitrophota bacterium]